MTLAKHQPLNSVQILFDKNTPIDDLERAAMMIVKQRPFINMHAGFIAIPTATLWCVSANEVLRDFVDNLRFIRLTKSFLD